MECIKNRTHNIPPACYHITNLVENGVVGYGAPPHGGNQAVAVLDQRLLPFLRTDQVKNIHNHLTLFCIIRFFQLFAGAKIKSQIQHPCPGVPASIVRQECKFILAVLIKIADGPRLSRCHCRFSLNHVFIPLIRVYIQIFRQEKACFNHGLEIAKCLFHGVQGNFLSRQKPAMPVLPFRGRQNIQGAADRIGVQRHTAVIHGILVSPYILVVNLLRKFQHFFITLWYLPAPFFKQGLIVNDSVKA